MRKNWNHHRKRRRTRLLVIALIVTGLLSLTAVTAARYVTRWTPGNAQAYAKAFYFTSDHLASGDVPVYQIGDFKPGTKESGGSALTFELHNYADDKRASEDAITYDVTATAAAGPAITGVTGGKINQGANGTATVALYVAEDNFQNGKATVTVTAKATAPYTQTLTAKYELYQHIEGVSHEVYSTKDTNTLLLYVTTNDRAGSVTITAPGGVLFDRTDTRLSGFSGTACTFIAEANAQYSFVFFKTNPADTFATGSFTVS